MIFVKIFYLILFVICDHKDTLSYKDPNKVHAHGVDAFLALYLMNKTFQMSENF